jgi:hypothetical protein
MSDKRYSREWWLKELETARKAHDGWRKSAQVAMKEYRGKEDKDGGDSPDFYPIFWANTQITHSALYNKTPAPDIRRRYQDAVVPKEVAKALERAIEFTLDQESVDDHAHRVFDDYLVSGLGVAKVEYLPTVEDDQITAQKIRLEYIPYDRFEWEPNKDWDDVGWICIQHGMSKAEVKAKFGVKVEIDASGDGRMSQQSKDAEAPNEDQVWVYEIWCRTTRTLHWIGKDTDEIDETVEDPLRLQGFYPITRPMMLNVKSGALVPKTDYSYIRPLCRYVDTLTKRIFSLTSQIKDVGAYDSSFPELAKIASPSAEDGTRVGVNGLSTRLLQAGGGRVTFDSVVAVQDNSGKVQVVASLQELREAAKGQIYETTGISDIVRGASVASESATAQQLKGQWANIRLARKQAAVNGFFRDTFRLMAEIVAEHYTPENLMQITGVQMTPEAVQFLRSDAMRSFAIDVETDSTIAMDEQADKKQRLEFTKTFTDYANIIMPQMQQGLIPADLGKGVLNIALGGFKYSEELEDALEALPGNAEQLGKLNQQGQQLQMQLQQAQQQMQAMQQELAKYQEAEEARKTATTQADVALKGAQTEKTYAETQQIGVADPANAIKAQAELVTAQSAANKAQLEEAVVAKQAETVLAPPPVTVDKIELQFDETGMPVGGHVIRNAQVIEQPGVQ